MRPEIKTRLDEYLYNLWPTGGLNLFDAIGDRIETITGFYPAYYWPSLEEPPNAEDLMYMYITHSGKKYVNQSVIEYVDRHSDLTPFQKFDLLAKLIVPGNYDNWSRRWAVLQKEYNPLNNYDMIEQGTDNVDRLQSETDERDTTDATDRKRVDNRADTETATNKQTINTHAITSGTNSAENYITPFNSGNTDISQGSSAGTRSVNDNTGDTITEDNRDRGTTGLETESLSNKRTESGSKGSTEKGKTDHTLTRSGNIGVTTSQQMLQAELDLRVYNFYDSIFADIDKILCERVYSLC